MPRKNIYCSEEDAELFEQAAAIHESGSMSAAIVEGLKMYIASKENTKEMTIEIKIGKKTQKFLAKPIK